MTPPSSFQNSMVYMESSNQLRWHLQTVSKQQQTQTPKQKLLALISSKSWTWQLEFQVTDWLKRTGNQDLGPLNRLSVNSTSSGLILWSGCHYPNNEDREKTKERNMFSLYTKQQNLGGKLHTYYQSKPKKKHTMTVTLRWNSFTSATSRFKHGNYSNGKNGKYHLRAYGFPNVVRHTCNPSTWEAKAEGSEVQALPQLYSEFKASLWYTRLSPKTRNKTPNQ